MELDGYILYIIGNDSYIYDSNTDEIYVRLGILYKKDFSSIELERGNLRMNNRFIFSYLEKRWVTDCLVGWINNIGEGKKICNSGYEFTINNYMNIVRKEGKIYYSFDYIYMESVRYAHHILIHKSRNNEYKMFCDDVSVAVLHESSEDGVVEKIDEILGLCNELLYLLDGNPVVLM